MDKIKNFTSRFEDIFSYAELFKSWREFKKGKRKKDDVSDFSVRLSKNIFDLCQDILSGNYSHGGYKFFRIFEPKARDIHKAMVRDRIVHHAIYRALYPFFDNLFIFDSYSCRIGKGTHRAIRRFEVFIRKESRNYTKTVWVLKGDIRKCFASVDHKILKDIIRRKITCSKINRVLHAVIDSFDSSNVHKGIPLGNLTSQLFVNVYLNEFDQFVKRNLKIKKYVRYADDFVIFSADKKYLENLIPEIRAFLDLFLKLELHPDKVSIKTINSGVDFLGWVHFIKYRLIRKSTEVRMYQKIFPEVKPEVIASYFGLLCYGNTYKIETCLKAKIMEKRGII